MLSPNLGAVHHVLRGVAGSGGLLPRQADRQERGPLGRALRDDHPGRHHEHRLHSGDNREPFVLLRYLQYYRVICHPSDRTVGRPRADIRSRDGRDTDHSTTTPPVNISLLIIL